MLQAPPIQPNTKEEMLDYAQRLTLWLKDAHRLLVEYEKRKVVRRTDASYQTTEHDYNVAVTDTAAPRTVTIASAFIKKENAVVTVSDESGGAAANNITVATEGAETINGAATATIAANYGAVRLRSDGANLYTIE